MQSPALCCVSDAPLFWFLEFGSSHYAVVVLFVLGASVVLPIVWTHVDGKVPKLSTQSETTRSLQQRRLCNNYNFGTATSDHGLKRSSVKIVQCKKVKLQSCRYRPLFWMQSSFVLCFEALLFWLLILTFPSQWHIFGVPRHSLCSGSFVCFGSHRSLANRTTVEVVVASQHSMNFSGTV